MMRWVAGAICALGVTICLTGSASAALITQTFSGQIGNVTSGLTGTFSIGDPFSVTATWDTNASPTSTVPLVFGGSLSFYEATVGAYTVTGVGDLFATDGASSNEAVWISMVSLGQISGAPVDGIPFRNSSFFFRDTTQAFYDGLSVPGAIDLGDWNANQFQLGFDKVGALFESATGTITSASPPIIVPEPTSTFLLGLGIVAMSLISCWRPR